ncbi:MAG: 3-methylcrotonyl-CoA carboxylase subunit alpha [Lysobacteraceae bacterium]|nr:MAG: 3-methylcrotonyl-CoA carboxylase subunit alpha [Xanthomonadaceae bacterium]
MSRRPFQRILIANRGEIACRVIATCRRLGIETIAVHSDADRNARHVRMADISVCVGPAAASESYLNIDRLIAVANNHGAEAVHPGYGFLSENATFATRLAEADIRFIGPSADTITQMGSKAEAKAVMEKANVPVVPGYHGNKQDIDTLFQHAEKIGYPLLIKASAGGGGKGMRIVQKAGDFAGELGSARREAKAAFGDDSVILERYLSRPRHVEVQVFGDLHGSVVHMFERDCSTQRRYQKVIEESPAPTISEEQRQAMCQAAVAAAQAVNYTGAGTVEFIVDDDGSFFFMEMNTRLQVEHPVTEMVTGLDLVEWQLRVAAGEKLPLYQDQIRSRGHAIEARVYAEDPNKGFLPGSGRLKHLSFPQSNDRVRIDTGVEQGDEVTVHYDPMIAKVIAWGEDRTEAIVALRQALQHVEIIGPADNTGFVEHLLQHTMFENATIHTATLDQDLQPFLPPVEPSRLTVAAAACSVLAAQERAARAAQLATSDAYSPWSIHDGWRSCHSGRRVIDLECGDRHYSVDARGFAGDYELSFEDSSYRYQFEEHGDFVNINCQNTTHRARVVSADGVFLIHNGQHRFEFKPHNPFAFEGGSEAKGDRVVAPMPGKIVSVVVNSGTEVAEGDPLVIMEAMKMELTLRAPRDGVVDQVSAQVDQFVEADTALVTLEK